MHTRPRTTQVVTRQLCARDDAGAGNAQQPADGERRAPRQGSSLLASPPALAAATERHRRHTSTPCVRQLVASAGPGSRKHHGPTKREKGITRRPYNARVHPRPLMFAPAAVGVQRDVRLARFRTTTQDPRLGHQGRGRLSSTTSQTFSGRHAFGRHSWDPRRTTSRHVPRRESRAAAPSSHG
jgi:hypothetical protein